jgi:hypothetical protein
MHFDLGILGEVIELVGTHRRILDQIVTGKLHRLIPILLHWSSGQQHPAVKEMHMTESVER